MPKPFFFAEEFKSMKISHNTVKMTKKAIFTLTFDQGDLDSHAFPIRLQKQIVSNCFVSGIVCFLESDFQIL